MPKGVYERKNRRNKREEILRAAARVYAHYGFEGATIERMAREAGVSRSLIIEHFGSKQELVKQIANQVVGEMLEKIWQIDRTPGLTLRRREALIHQLIQQDREKWCLVLGTMLVPHFDFQARGELAEYLQANRRTVMEHSRELRDPTEESARAYSHSATYLHIGFLIDGQADEYQNAMERHMDLYLLPE